MQTVLISGASFAGLSTAYWMNKLGYQVTIVEIAPALKKGGTPVNILGNTIDIAKRMGLFEQIKANSINMGSMEFRNAHDQIERVDERGERGEEEYEIERDLLLDMLHESIKHNTNILYGDSITSLAEQQHQIHVTFKNAHPRTFDLVFGCDGIHSVVRRLWFGEEAQCSRFLQAYFSITIVNKLLIPEFTNQLYSEPGRTVMLNAYNGKTDICLCFFTAQELAYDYRNEPEQRKIINDAFNTTGWRTPELLKEVAASPTFYFDKLCQMKMASWTKGRVALVGDAGYCPSPAAGRGGSIAIDGAAALAAAFEKYPGDFNQAFREYNESFRPFIEAIQEEVVNFSLEALVPRTEEAIANRNKHGFGF